MGFSIVIPFTASGERIFGFVAPSFAGIGTILLIMIMYIAATEAAKLAYLRFSKKVLSPR